MAEENKALSMFNVMKQNGSFNNDPNSAALAAGINSLSGDLSAMRKTISGGLSPKGTITGQLKKEFAELNKVIVAPAKILKNSLDTMNRNLTNGINGIRDSVKDSITSMKQYILAPFNKFKDAFNGLKSMFANPFKKLGNLFGSLRDKMKKRREDLNQNRMFKSIFSIARDMNKLLQNDKDKLKLQQANVDKNRYSVKKHVDPETGKIVIENENTGGGGLMAAIAGAGGLIAGFFKSGISKLATSVAASLLKIGPQIGSALTKALGPIMKKLGLGALKTATKAPGVITSLAKTTGTALMGIGGSIAGLAAVTGASVVGALILSSYLSDKAEERAKELQAELANILNSMFTSPNQRFTFKAWGINNNRLGDLTNKQIVTMVSRSRIPVKSQSELIEAIRTRRDAARGEIEATNYDAAVKKAEAHGTLSQRLAAFDKQLNKPSPGSTSSATTMADAVNNNKNKKISSSAHTSGMRKGNAKKFMGVTNDGEGTEAINNESPFLLEDGNEDLNGLQRSTLDKLTAMAKEYQSITGNPLQINSAKRSLAEQKKLFESLPAGRAAKPGQSMHNFGVAIDIPSEQIKILEANGLLNDYEFNKTIPKEPWHIEDADYDRKRLKKLGASVTARYNQTGEVDSNNPIFAAKGAILTGASPVIAGEAGAEAIIPLNNQGLDFMVTAINKAINITGSEKKSSNDSSDKLRAFLLGPFVEALGNKIANSRIRMQGTQKSNSTAINAFN